MPASALFGELIRIRGQFAGRTRSNDDPDAE